MHALKVLEFEAVRGELAKRCETALGAERASLLQPSFDAKGVWAELGMTAEAHALLGESSPPSLGGARDLREAFGKAGKGGALGGHELFQCAECLAAMRQLKSFVAQRKDLCPRLSNSVEAIPELPKLEEALLRSLEPDGSLKDSASPELGQLRRKKAGMQGRIVDKIRSYVSGKARELLSEPIYTIRDGRYVIPLKADFKGRIKGIVHDTSASGQTVYLEPEDVLQLGNQLREIESAEREEEERILLELSGMVGGVADEAVVGIEQTGFLDFNFAKARLAYDLGGEMPLKSTGFGIDVQQGRHPLLDRETAVPLTIRVGWELPGLLITGPNTGGKTVAIKTVGLLMLMAQSGLFPPADQVRLGPFSQVWADIGDEQSIAQSLSTFSGHVRNIAEALKGLKPGALVLLDEIGAGTDPAEGAALAKAILLAFKEGGASTLASTHYGELKAFAYNAEGFQNAAMEFDENTLAPTYHLIMGAPGASHALRIAERYGIPIEVVQEAFAGLSPEQQDVAQMLEKLEMAEKQTRAARSEADQRAAEVKKLEAEAERKLAEASEIRRTVHAGASAMIEDALREIRLEAERLFEELKAAAGDTKGIERIRGDLKALQGIGEEVKSRFEEPLEKKSESAKLERGHTVRIEGYAQTGVILENPKGESVAVQVGPLRLSVSVSKLTPVQLVPASPKKARPNLQFSKALSAKTELTLRAMRAENAIEELERFMDDAVLAGLDRVRIVHGKGEGVLRKVTQEFLRKHKQVSSFREGEPGEGGAGVTIAVLK